MRLIAHALTGEGKLMWDGDVPWLVGLMLLLCYPARGNHPCWCTVLSPGTGTPTRWEPSLLVYLLSPSAETPSRWESLCWCTELSPGAGRPSRWEPSLLSGGKGRRQATSSHSSPFLLLLHVEGRWGGRLLTETEGWELSVCWALRYRFVPFGMATIK